MSRSKKRYPGCADRNPFMKNYANRRLRRLPVDHVIANGKSYRKYACSYDLCDFKWFEYVDTLQAYLIAKQKEPLRFGIYWINLSDDDLVKQYWREVSK